MKIDQRSPLLEVGRELRRISGPVEPKSAAIGMEGERAEITPYQAPVDLEPSPALSLVGKAKPTLKGRNVGALVTDGADGDERASIRRRLLQRSARDVAEKAFARGGDYDEDGAYPVSDVAALHESGLLTAVLPVRFGGAELTGLFPSGGPRSIGWGGLSLGRG